MRHPFQTGMVQLLAALPRLQATQSLTLDPLFSGTLQSSFLESRKQLIPSTFSGARPVDLFLEMLFAVGIFWKRGVDLLRNTRLRLLFSLSFPSSTFSRFPPLFPSSPPLSPPPSRPPSLPTYLPRSCREGDACNQVFVLISGSVLIDGADVVLEGTRYRSLPLPLLREQITNTHSRMRSFFSLASSPAL